MKQTEREAYIAGARMLITSAERWRKTQEHEAEEHRKFLERIQGAQWAEIEVRNDMPWGEP